MGKGYQPAFITVLARKFKYEKHQIINRTSVILLRKLQAVSRGYLVRKNLKDTKNYLLMKKGKSVYKKSFCENQFQKSIYQSLSMGINTEVVQNNSFSFINFKYHLLTNQNKI